MESILMILQSVYENLPLIMTIGAVGVGIVIRIRNFMKLSKDEKVAKLQEQADKVVELVQQQLLSVVSRAEKEWGGGTGIIKKAWVWEQLTLQYKKLIEFIETGMIDKKLVDDLIEEAVSELHAIVERKEDEQEEVEL